MEILILGTGCPKCLKLAQEAHAAAEELGIAPDVRKVTQVAEIMKFGVMLTPALVVDGEVKAAGRVPSRTEIKAMLS